MKIVDFFSSFELLHGPCYNSANDRVTPEDLYAANAKYLEKQKNAPKKETLQDILDWIYASCRICGSEIHRTDQCPYPWGWSPSLLEKKSVRQLLKPYKIVDPPIKPSIPLVVDTTFHAVSKNLSFAHRDLGNWFHSGFFFLLYVLYLFTLLVLDISLHAATTNHKYSAGSFELLPELNIGTSINSCICLFCL